MDKPLPKFEKPPVIDVPLSVQFDRLNVTAAHLGFFWPILNKICELGDLPPDWDSYGALPIDPETAAFGVGLLLNVLKPDDPVPAVVPTSRGGLMFEWHEGGIDLEIDVRSPFSIHVAFADGAHEEEFESPQQQQIQDKLNVLRGRLGNATGLR
jgi:hypothetical protein